MAGAVLVWACHQYRGDGTRSSPASASRSGKLVAFSMVGLRRRSTRPARWIMRTGFQRTSKLMSNAASLQVHAFSEHVSGEEHVDGLKQCPRPTVPPRVRRVAAARTRRPLVRSGVKARGDRSGAKARMTASRSSVSPLTTELCRTRERTSSGWMSRPASALSSPATTVRHHSWRVSSAACAQHRVDVRKSVSELREDDDLLSFGAGSAAGAWATSRRRLPSVTMRMAHAGDVGQSTSWPPLMKRWGQSVCANRPNTMSASPGAVRKEGSQVAREILAGGSRVDRAARARSVVSASSRPNRIELSAAEGRRCQRRPSRWCALCSNGRGGSV